MLAQKADGIGTMTFNNPEKRNAVSFAMWKAAEEILADFAADPAVRVVILTGAGGKAFVSGADVSKFEDERSEVEAVQRYNAATEAIYSGLHRFPKPTIAKIRGFCIGGGLGLAVSCDLRIATENSKFALPAAKLGLGYGFAPLRRLSEVVGVPFAKEIFFTARQFTAREAEIMGLVNRVLPDNEIDSYVEDYTRTIAANAPLTIGTAKYVFQQIVKDPGDRDVTGCAERVRRCFASRDYGEGRLAFMEKRAPAFTGS
ncbi:MAG: enoyl-CoA hydratase/isomerase family protein [Methylobacteriaceae bacterium]|nr:enoyl-CoA hydratase/isomerase family protein [Methylobacteriaceae bacterium]